MGYSTKAALGFSGQTAIKVAGSLLAVLKVGVVARVLGPGEFGLFSLVVIALGLTEAFTQTGVNTTIVQSKNPVKFFVNSAWVIAILRGMAIGAMMVLMGWGMSQYYQQPILWSLVVIAALVPVIKGFINPAIVEMHKELQFLKDSLYRFSLVVVENLAIISLVLLFKSVEAWIGGLVVAAVVEVAISFIFFRLKPRWQYEKAPAQEIFHQTRVLSISSLLSYLLENVDNLIIGKIVGEYGLGLYQPAYALAHEPNFEIAKSVHHGTLPVYTKISRDRARLRRAFTKTSLVTLALTITLSLPLFLFPELIIRVVLDQQWLEVVNILRWLGLAGILQGISLVIYTPLIAQKRVDLTNWHMGLNAVCMIGLLVLWGHQYGLPGAVMGVVVARLVTLPVLFFLSFRHLK